VEKLFKDITDGVVSNLNSSFIGSDSEICDQEAINMSVDSMTGRNPSYCFVDFTSKDLAERMMGEFNGRDFMRRPLKVKPGVKPSSGGARFHIQSRNGSEISPTYNRWDRLDRPESVNSASEERRRLFVGGLPAFPEYGHSEIVVPR
jgi:RNA recognition motif-containing protein